MQLAGALLISLLLGPGAWCQEEAEGETRASQAEVERKERAMQRVFDYLNMAEGGGAEPFQPLTQRERNLLYGKSLINPVWYLRGALSAGQNQRSDEPPGWEQGASGYGKRFADIMGQYAVRRTVTFGLESLLHEDNRHFASGKKGFWKRTGYGLSSGLLARHDNGKRYPSASLLVGMASGAYLSRFWQPEGNRTVGDAAVSFGVSMGWNMGLGVMKEFLPDILKPLRKGPKAPSGVPSSPGSSNGRPGRDPQ